MWWPINYLITHRLPSITSTRSSAVAFGSRIATSALLILYSLKIALISSWSIFVSGTVFVIAIPPFSFLRHRMAGGFLFSRIPKPSSSDSISFLSPRGLRTSRTMKMRLHVRATGMRSEGVRLLLGKRMGLRRARTGDDWSRKSAHRLQE